MSRRAVRELILALCDALRTPPETVQQIERLLDTFGAPGAILQSPQSPRVVLLWRQEGVDLEIDLAPAATP